MQIKQGFNDSPTNIRVDVDGTTIRLWIEQTGLTDTSKTETLSYMTAEELLALYNEVKNAGRELFS